MEGPWCVKLVPKLRTSPWIKGKSRCVNARNGTGAHVRFRVWEGAHVRFRVWEGAHVRFRV